MTVVIIAAVADNGVIGAKGRIPWHISDDLKRFKRLTLGHTVIMGRNTFASIGKPLPGRRNIVLTKGDPLTGVACFASLHEALQSCGGTTAFVIGGAQVYREALPVADMLLITHVHMAVEGDTRFPDYDRSQWHETHREDHDGYSFVEYRRIQ